MNVHRAAPALATLSVAVLLAGCPNITLPTINAVPLSAAPPSAGPSGSTVEDRPSSGPDLAMKPSTGPQPSTGPSTGLVPEPGQAGSPTPMPVPSNVIATESPLTARPCGSTEPRGLTPTLGGTPATGEWSMAAYAADGTLIAEDGFSAGSPPITFQLPAGCPIRLRLVRPEGAYTETIVTFEPAATGPISVDFPNPFVTPPPFTAPSQVPLTSPSPTSSPQPSPRTSLQPGPTTSQAPSPSVPALQFRFGVTLDCRIPLGVPKPDLVKLVPNGDAPTGNGWDADIIWSTNSDGDGHLLGTAQLDVPVGIPLDAYQGHGYGDDTRWFKTSAWNFQVENTMTSILPTIRMVDSRTP